MEKTDKMSIVEEIETFFVTNVHLISDNTDIQTLDEPLSSAENCVKQSLNSIEEVLKSNNSTNIQREIANELNVCLSILESTLSLSKRITSLGYVEVEDVDSYLRHIGQIMLHIFTHCKNSETLYSSYIEQVGSLIQSVFKKCYELQTVYFKIITDYICFDFNQDQQLDVLHEVMDSIVDIGEIVIHLDVKAMAEVWKCYSKICDQHYEIIKDKYILEKATKSLCNELKNNLKFILSEKSSNAKDVTRSLKMSNFILKILVKMSELFRGSMLENYNHIVDCLLYINQYSLTYLSFIKVNPNIIEAIQTHIQIGAELFLSNLLSDLGFKYFVLQEIPKIITDESLQFGCIHLMVTIMKLLLEKQDDIREQWIDDLIYLLFDVIQYCHIELLKQYEFECFIIGRVSLYDYILLYSSSLIISNSCFNKIERKLLESIIHSNIWKSMLALDVWTIIIKKASEELCFDQLTYLISLFEEVSFWRAIKNTPQRIFLSCLFYNLFNALPNNFKIKLYEMYPVSMYTHLWKVMGLFCLPTDEILVENNKLLKTSLTLNECTKSQLMSNFKNVNDCLQLLDIVSFNHSKMDQTDINKLVFKIFEAWNLLNTIHDINKLNSCVVLLCNITQNIAPYLSNDVWLKVLLISTNMMSKCKSTVKISILQMLKCFTYLDLKNDEYKERTLNKFKIIINKFANNDCHMIRLMFINFMVYFLKNCKDNTLLINSISDNDQLKEIMRNIFVKRKLFDSLYEVINQYKFASNEIFTHKCIKLDYVNDCNDVIDCLKILKDECNNLKCKLKDKSLPEQQKCELKNINNIINEILYKC